jgi:uncharacterized protein
VINAALDDDLVAHVAFSENGQPFCIPMLYARIFDSLYVHGASSSRAMRRLGEGVPVTALTGWCSRAPRSSTPRITAR